MRPVRVLLGLVGLAAAAWGIRLLLDQGGANLWAATTWLVGGVVLHDAVLAPATVLVAAGASYALRRRVPGPVVVGAVVLGTVTVVAVPVLGRFGARADNATLLDRDYTLGWGALAGLTLLGVGAGLLLERRRTKGGRRGTRAGR